MDKKRPRRLIYSDFSLNRMVRSVVFIYIAFAAIIFFASDSMMSHPESSFNRSWENHIFIKTADGESIAGVHARVEGARYTILLSHGNGEDIGDLDIVFARLNGLGLSVFAYDYRGYGASGGVPSEVNAYRDIDAAYAYVVGALGVPRRVFWFTGVLSAVDQAWTSLRDSPWVV